MPLICHFAILNIFRKFKFFVFEELVQNIEWVIEAYETKMKKENLLHYKLDFKGNLRRTLKG